MISIKGVRLESISITDLKEGNGGKITADYSLMSSTDTVLAKQGVNGYNEIAVQFSPATIAALRALVNGLKQDVELTLGIVEVETTKKEG